MFGVEGFKVNLRPSFCNGGKCSRGLNADLGLSGSLQAKEVRL